MFREFVKENNSLFDFVGNCFIHGSALMSVKNLVASQHKLNSFFLSKHNSFGDVFILISDKLT